MKNIGDFTDIYRIIQIQDTSALSESYIVEQTSQPGLLYVLQFWPDTHIGNNGQSYSAFLSAMNALKGLHSPLILPIENSGDDATDGPYVLLPYTTTQLEPLSKRLQRGTLTRNETRKILKDVGSALVLAHQHGCIHGFLSPESILLNTEGEACVAAFRTSALDTTMARASLPVEYRFPETQASRLSDQYALAGLLQALLLDRADESAGEDVTSLQQAVERAQKPDPAQRFPGIRTFLSAVDIPLDLEENEQELETLPAQPELDEVTSTQTSFQPPWNTMPSGTSQPVRPKRRFVRPGFFTWKNARIAVLSLFLVITLIVLHITLPAGTATVTIIPGSQSLDQTYDLTVGTQTNLASRELRAHMLSYKTSTQTEDGTVQNQVDIAATSAQGKVVFSQLSSEINLLFEKLSINLGTNLELTVDDTTTDMKPGNTYTEPVTVAETGSQGNLPAHYVDGTYTFSPFGIVGGPNETTAFLSNPEPITGGQDGYSGPAVAQTDIDPLTSSLQAQENEEAHQHFQTQLQSGEMLLPDLVCTQVNNIQPKIGSHSAKVTVSSYANCQVETYDQQGVTAAFLSAAQQLAAHSFDPHFALIQPISILITSAGAPAPGVLVSFDVLSEWHLLLDKRGMLAVQQSLTGLSQDDARALLQKRYDAVTTNLSLSWWWGGHLPAVPDAIQIIAHYPAP